MDSEELAALNAGHTQLAGTLASQRMAAAGYKDIVFLVDGRRLELVPMVRARVFPEQIALIEEKHGPIDRIALDYDDNVVWRRS